MYMHHKRMSSETPPVSCACATLRKTTRAVTRLYDEALADSGLTTVQFSILRNLDRHGELPLSRLADLLVMDRTSLYRTIAPLERHHWVETRASDRGKARTATLTQEGRRVMASATPAWEATQRRIIGGIGIDAWRSIEGVLGQLVDVARGEAA